MIFLYARQFVSCTILNYLLKYKVKPTPFKLTNLQILQITVYLLNDYKYINNLPMC